MPDEPSTEEAQAGMTTESVAPPEFIVRLPDERWAMYLIQICRVALGHIADSREGGQVLAVMSIVESAIEQNRRTNAVVNRIAAEPREPSRSQRQRAAKE